MKPKHRLKGNMDHIFHNFVHQIHMRVKYLAHKQVKDLLKPAKKNPPIQHSQKALQNLETCQSNSAQ